MFSFAAKFQESSLEEAIDKSIIIKNAGDNPFIARLSNDLQPVWQYDIEERGGQFTPGLQEIIFFEAGQSAFLNRDSGKVQKKEPVYYFRHQPPVTAFVVVENADILVIQYKGHEVKIDHINSQKFFYGDYLIQVPYTEKTMTCHSLIDGSLVWKLILTELAGSDKVQLYSDVILYGNRLFFFLSDLNDVSATFVLELATGRVVQCIDKFGGRLNLHHDIIYIVNQEAIGMLQADTFDIQRVNLADQLQPQKTKMAWDVFSLQNNYLYFSDAHKAAIGAFDLSSQKIVWYNDLASQKGIRKIIKVQAHNDLLFLHGADLSLYILKRDV
jgi:hypothetical protein